MAEITRVATMSDITSDNHLGHLLLKYMRQYAHILGQVRLNLMLVLSLHTLLRKIIIWYPF